MFEALEVPTGTMTWDRSKMKLNVSHETIHRNIETNIRRHLPQLALHDESPEHIALVGGGWSLDQTFEELRALYFRGVKLVALNGAANWLMARNLRPSMHIIMDAKPENAAFVQAPIPHCKYFLASQCDPSVFDACEGRDVRVFHVISTDGEEEREVLDKYYNRRWHIVPGAGTVGMVGLMMCRMLGFRFQHLFGIDSCSEPETGAHHAYDQPWNNDDGARWFWCAGRKFLCSGMQASQVGNFVDIVSAHGDKLELKVHGPGILAHILETGGEMRPLAKGE